VGWQNVLEHDWGHDKRFEIPDVSQMEWTDVLDQEIMIMNE
jgi:hypothetical protein